MRPSSTACTVILAALLLVPGALWAGGSSESARPDGTAPAQPATQMTIQAYWILEAGAANAEMLLERFYLPTSLSVLRWNEFVAAADGVELTATGGYRVVRKEAILTEAWNGSVLRGYSVRVDFSGEADKPSRSSRRLAVGFAYDTAQAPGGQSGGGVAPQPLQQALLKGIEASGRKSGLARVLELEYRGKGRFQAQVEVQ